MILARLAPVLLLLLSGSAAAQGPVKVRRFAFLAGANDGGEGRVRLRYATSDAHAVSRVLTEMGGVRGADLIFSDEPDRAELLRQLGRLRLLVAAARVPDVRIELIFYYSGHSDEDGLLLRGQRLTYPDLRARIEEIPADVRVAVLDSCASGALTRHKGGVFRPPFMTDDSVKLTGNAFLASSAANEVAQESDRIAASFFTHFLVSGLRGAADANGDRRVTFFEAYQFASQETLARTELTRGGAQHAAYDISLNGTGDLVMTDVRATSAGLVLRSELQGFISVRDAGARLVAELRKAPGHPVELGLDPGKYVVTMTGVDTAFEASVELHEGQRTEVGALAFQPRSLELARSRGDDPTTLVAPAPPLRTIPFSLGIVPLGPSERVRKNISISLLADRAAQVHGAQLSVGINWADEEVHGFQGAAAANITDGPVSGMQASSGANYARGEVHGAQGSAGVNITLSALEGFQGAAGANYVHDSMVGFQGAAGINWTTRDMTGVQLAAGFNGTAGTMHGLQAAVLNYAGESEGAQLGVANVTGVSHGLQLGVVNLSDEDHGLPIGILSYARRNGILEGMAYSTESSLANVGLKIGGHTMFNTFGFGMRPGREGNRFCLSLGLGARARVDRSWLSFIDSEVAASTFTHAFDNQSRLQILSSLRVVAGWRLASRFAIVAGPTLNVLVRKRGFDTDIAPGALETVLHDGPTRVSLYPGLVLGVQI